MSFTQEQVKNLSGLSETEVLRRRKEDGFNELPSAKKKSIFHIVFEVMKEPMFLLLVACGGLYCILGDIQEAVMLLGFVGVIIGITVYQEGKTEKALSALRDLSSPRALVIRDGERRRIAGREVIRGDYIILAEGDRVPADGILVWGLNLKIDESLLTGESIAVEKEASIPDIEMDVPGGDGQPFVFSGTLVVHGQGVAWVKKIGAHTQMGKIGKSLGEVSEEDTTLKKETGRIVRTVFVIALTLCFLLTGVYGLLQNDWLKAVLNGLKLAMAMLPEEFPVVLTVFLALGAWRISKKQVLTRKVAAIETLGAATVFCVDKTGTLTENKMSIALLHAHDAFYDVEKNKREPLPEFVHALVEYGILASKKDPFDPMEKALLALGEHKLKDTEHIHEDWEMVHEYPLSKELLALSHVWISPDKNEYCIAAKGAPEAIADLCHFSEIQLKALQQEIQEIAGKGLRVLGVARADFKKSDRLPGEQHDFDFQFLGLLGLADPIRDTVPSAVSECRRAGIRVVMITGDYPSTAMRIGEQIGLDNSTMAITGPELNTMADEQLMEKIGRVNIFARVVPEQKLRIVNALKQAGEIVSMTGDGVNDAPALKSAHIGIAMGQRGTDVAREASNLVLLDDSFPSIVSAVKMGRRIFDNLRKAMAYIISVHIPIAGMALLPVLLGWKDMEILTVVHIVFLELIIDPACSVVFESEPEEKDIMDRPPRKKTERLFSRKTLLLSTLQGIIALVVVFGVCRVSMALGQSIAEVRTLTFITLIISNLCLILTNRSWSSTIFRSFAVKNSALPWVAGGALIFLGLVVYIPVLQDLFHFGFMHATDILIAVGAGIGSVVWFEVLKVFMQQKKKIPHKSTEAR
ncbi:MAG: cation-translocating P-type ATPase [Spirochaetales bacterium]|nr:cation-translocating P-type ATPase [Spirochaetales bacterium]